MIHIVFGASASGSLTRALRNRKQNETEQVISFWDIFSVGPIWQLHNEKGRQFRYDWMAVHLNEESIEELADYQQRFEQSVEQIQAIQNGEQLYIWLSNSTHEQVGLRYIIYLLKEKDIQMTVLNTALAQAKLFPVMEDSYILRSTGELTFEQLQTIFEQYQGQLLSMNEREILEKEWCTLSESQDTLRIWQDGHVQHVEESYYDARFIHHAKDLHQEQETKNFMKSARLIGEVLGYLDDYVGDEFLQYRLRELIKQNVFEMEGQLRAMRYYSVRLL
ncbi:DUF1835 domain-containing protein [Lysinibacillus piscis]|uniref:DUF1835 domain-containing protein n=1 Tax=Lysinibacillus piscis TaxID=2518931 RepID=A0ABQ5NMW1_9BACI|nr:DUF1835 domain-containing protein [Lysinibacillus sp. KH24]GLC89642.1 hypothetical protein LYSBPC_27690 [Lysinibacillus sp. KH24]